MFEVNPPTPLIDEQLQPWILTPYPYRCRDSDLSRNQLMTVPDEVTSLTRLQRLSLSHNNLFELPRSLQALVVLEVLEADGNVIDALTDDERWWQTWADTLQMIFLRPFRVIVFGSLAPKFLRFTLPPLLSPKACCFCIRRQRYSVAAVDDGLSGPSPSSHARSKRSSRGESVIARGRVPAAVPRHHFGQRDR